jgi:hypothetical protein
MSLVWDPELNDRLLSLHLLAREILWGISVGMQRSMQVTKSIEFVEHREYQPGDPISAIDWKVYARTDRVMIRRQQADTEGTMVLVLDASADMDTTDSGQPNFKSSKLGRAITALAALTLYAQKRAEPVGLLIIGGTGAEHQWIPPSRRAVGSIFNALASVEGAKKADLKQGLSTLVAKLSKPSIVFIASDWMEEPSEWGIALENLASMRHDIRGLHLYSKLEWTFKIPDSVRLYGKEDGREIPLQREQVSQRFLEEVAKYKLEIVEWSSRAKAVWSYAALEEELTFPLVKLVKGTE